MNRRKGGRRSPILSRSSSLAREVGQQHVRKTVVAVCEGTKTEPQYIEALADDDEVRQVAAVSLRLEAADKGEVPLTLVRRAIDIKRRAEKENGEIDEVWCVFDVEWPQNHPHLKDALQAARANGIMVAVSNPCFELWLVLHFRKAASFMDNDQARRERRKHDEQDDKHINAAVYADKRRTAVANAKALEKMHTRNGTQFPHDNPSSGMYRLVESVTSVPGSSA